MHAVERAVGHRVLALLMPLAAVHTFAACAPIPARSEAGPSLAASATGSYRDERVLVGSFARLDGVAASRRFLYTTSSNGIGVYDRWSDRWLPPLSRAEGLPDAPISVLAGDPVEDALWFGVPGALYSYRPQTTQLQQTILAGVPESIAFDRTGTGDVMVRASGRWQRVSRLGMASTTPDPDPATLLLPQSPAALLQTYPQLRIQLGQLLRTPQANRPLREPVLRGLVASPDRPSELWLATAGEGLYRVDPNTLQARAIPYGLLEPGVGALARAADGIWSAGLGLDADRGGLTFTTASLQQWRWIEGTIAVPLAGRRAFALASRGERLWIGTDRGLVRVTADRTADVRDWTRLAGLVDDRVLAVAPRGEGAFVGTPRGLQYVSDSVEGKGIRSRSVGATLLANIPVAALLFVGDTLWAGTAAGLVAVADPVTPGGPSALVTVARPLDRGVRALAWSDSVLVAVTDDAVWMLHPRSATPVVRDDRLIVTSVGQPTRIGIDDRSIILAGTQGVLSLSRTTGSTRLLRDGIDFAGPVLDLLLDRDWLWLATPQGLHRLARGSDGHVR